MTASSANGVFAKGADDRTLALRAAMVFLALYAVLFAAGPIFGQWLIDAQGQPLQADFVNVWAAGRMALEGKASAAYDWDAHRLYEVMAVGHDFEGYFGWHYPPMFLLVAAPLSLIPYVASQLVWMAATLPVYALAIRLIWRRWDAVLIALAFPAVAMNFAFGQNGFLTAGLLGCALALLDKRPIVAGVLIGLLTYKPQFGLLIPLALLAGGCWRTIMAASVTALTTAALTTLAFGAEIWPAFLASTKLTNHAVLEMGWASFSELVSPFGASRWLGLSYWGAWAVQGAVVAMLAALVWVSWRRPGADNAKRALLAAACVSASPYAYVYDLTTLGVAIAFLTRDGCSARERFGIAAVCLMILTEPVSSTPLTALAGPLVAALAVARLRAKTAPAGLVRAAMV